MISAGRTQWSQDSDCISETGVASEPVVWHGTDEERDQLLDCLNRNCACDQESNSVCAAHRMLTSTDAQRILDGLRFARYLRDRLEREEFRVSRSSRTPKT